MNIQGLQTARMGSKSIHNKNILMVNGKPLYKNNLDNTRQCKLIENVFVSTDIPQIIETEQHVIVRPDYLCQDNSSHYDAIFHGLHEIDTRTGKFTDILVIILGNALGAHPTIIDAAIQYMIDTPKVDSCMSVGEFNMFTPYRAYKENGEFLTTHIPQETIRDVKRTEDFNNKNAYEPSLFFNGSFWICRRRAIMDNNGLLPFPWLGHNIKPIHQSPEFQELDAEWQLKMMQ